MSLSSFEIKTAKDLFLKLTREHERLMSDLHSPDYAINFSITAHHLFKDWLRRELSPDEFKTLETTIDINLRTEMGIIRDVCDGSKHLHLTKPPHLQVRDSSIRRGAFSSAFSRAFDIGGLVVTLHDGAEIYFDSVADAVLAFWREYFESQSRPGIISIE